ncbi:V-type ATP synthase subunit A [Leptospira sp. GIMC2001]|uniref:V-type ATP synthase subunit A n=1 Tax=Leptospira sp. GIMC2001 TaxID=1513297 RepID=UPI00234AE185|nr:V-type ATP synthase subunit A [Leptospira sp. GIMC2001]WCL49069.1 V-type ATP synthase subunit A [Leptospira sp. GIMC2001]
MTKGKIIGIVSNLVYVEANGSVGQNEICYILHNDLKLMAEVIKINGNVASAQVFESTRGIKMGTLVEFTGKMLEIDLGPGLLSKKYDGLLNDLDKLSGVFLKRGDKTDPLDADNLFDFTPISSANDNVVAGDWLGNVKENWIDHKIMVPFSIEGRWKIDSIVSAGQYKVDDTIAVLSNSDGQIINVSMRQKWPIKIPITSYKNKMRPFKIMEMGIRAIDTLNPMPEGGTGFIPGPFGCGKTVLQHAMSKNAMADLIILTACGERANEVVEIFKEFPELDDPRTGRKLMERTTIICNTSNMPVAAREASVYTGMTLAEYYRSMGLRVLLLADSTSRWAQALREMSNRLEELPGQDAFPMDLSSIISSFYARAGYVTLNNDQTGSITFVGTVSPAGGNLKEPVAESTKKAARCFYALSQKRADSKRYPAIDPLDSYSKYIEYLEFQEDIEMSMGNRWIEKVELARNILRKGQEAYDQINILGDDSVPIEYHISFWKSELIDFIILQQDAFDSIDSNTPIQRQKYMLDFILEICDRIYQFNDFEEIAGFFKSIIYLLKQMNYQEYEGTEFRSYRSQVITELDKKSFLSNQHHKIESIQNAVAQ